MTAAFDNICSLPLLSDVFTQVLHPHEPLLTVGLSSGHVQTYKLPPAAAEDGQDHRVSATERAPRTNGDTPQSILRRSSTSSENGLDSINPTWTTRRHKGSCRALAYRHDGEICYSAGSDGLVKAFDTDTGRVVSKIAIPRKHDVAGDEAGPSVLHALSPQGLLLGTDNGELYYHDLRAGGSQMVGTPAQSWTPHADEHVNALVPLPVTESSTSGFPKQWVSVGGTTLAVTDMRKGVIATSDNQEVELTSIAFVSGLKKGGTSVGEKILVGQSDGVVSLWERGVWGDLDERIVVDRYESGVDALAEVPMAWARKRLKMNEKLLAAGLEDGRIRFLRVGRNGIISQLDIKHDEVDGVVGLGFDVTGRMVSSGGEVVKVWTEAKGLPGGGRNGVNPKRQGSEDDGDDGDGDGDGSDHDRDEYDQDNDSDDLEHRDESKRKRRKRNRGKDKSGGKAIDFEL